MPIAAFLLTTGLILGSWWALFSALRRASASSALLYAGLMTAAQVVLTQLALAIGGRLSPRPLIIVNVVCAAGCLAGTIWRRRRAAGAPGSVRRIATAIAAATRWENILLALLVAFTALWLVAAAVFLPPRTIEDLAYHLPPLYQAVQSHRLELLPVALRDAFAFPFNGGLLLLWPLVLLRGDAMIELVQLVVVLYGMLAVYALGRRLDVSARTGAFAALLFLFVPVVLGLSGSNGSDLIAGVFHLVLLFAAISFYQTGDGLDLVMAAVASGFLLGARYSMLLSVAFVQPILWLRLWRDAGRLRAIGRYALSILVALPLGAYWPVRNYLATGSPLYPLQATWSGFRLAPESTLGQISHPDIPTLWGDWSSDPWKLLTLPVRDPGLGSLYGGLGIVFWGFCVPALIYCLAQAVRAAVKSGRLFPLILWGQVLAGVFAPLLVPSEAIDFAPRSLVFVAGLGLVAFATVFGPITTLLRGSGPMLRALAVAASVLAVIHLASYRWPLFQIAPAVADWKSGRYVSEFAYLPQTGSDVPSLSEIWTPLDYLTRDGPGWTVYMASGHPSFWTAPSFGSQLQNRVWNFETAPAELPDALIYHRDQRGLPYYYVGSRILPQDVAADGRYELIAQTPNTKLWVKRELLDQPEVSAKLADYYGKGFGSFVAVAQDLLPAFNVSDAVFMTSSRLGYGLRYLALKGALPIRVVLVPENAEATFAERLGAKNVYTVGKSLPGYESHTIAVMNSPRGQVPIYLNIKA